MKTLLRLLPWVLVLVLVVPFLRPERHAAGPDPTRLGQLPVLDGGRLKPWETVARATLMRTRGRASALDADGKRLSASAWLADLLLAPDRAQQHRIYRVDDPDLLSSVGVNDVDVAHLSLADLRPHLAALEAQHRQIPTEPADQSRYQRALTRLRSGILEVQRLEDALLPPAPTAVNLAAHLADFGSGDPNSPADLALLRTIERMAAGAPPLTIPLPDPAVPYPGWADTPWSSAGQILLATVRGGSPEPMMHAWARLGDAWRGSQAGAWELAATDLDAAYAARVPDAGWRVRGETFFQRHSPFALGLQLYVLAFIVAAASWAVPRFASSWRESAWQILLLAWVVHSLGVVARMIFSGYAPVTNLYSSAVFVGWAAVAMALPAERRHRRGLVTAVAGLIGFGTLIIAHQLAVLGGGDTLEMMRAVLDSNFWLSTHVVTITLGYSATFLAGFVGLGALGWAMAKRREPDPATTDLVFGITAFSLLFSFVGTVLGGIWADQSWGRFWGWDPKENGALLVVVWNALLIHARVGGLAGPRGQLQIAVAGNIIVAWSWFGTNMLGVGLHSYGFMDRAFPWLVAFWLAHLAFIAVASLLRPKRSGAA